MKEIKLTQNQTTLIDDDDFDRVSQFSWYAEKSKNHAGEKYRVKTSVGKRGQQKPLYLHRFIMNAPDGLLVDHIDGNPLNNQKSNLRFANPFQNQFNRRCSKNNTSGYKGVTFNKYAKKWKAYINANRKQIHIGYFETARDAAIAYNEVVERYHGEFAVKNDV